MDYKRKGICLAQRPHVCRNNLASRSYITKVAFNHFTDKQDEIGVVYQVVTYTVLMLVIGTLIARSPVQKTLGLTMALAPIFVVCGTLALQIALETIESK